MKLCLLITIIALNLVGHVHSLGESCVNHNNDKGICAAITKCPTVDAIYKKYISSRQDRNSYNILIANVKSCGNKVQGNDHVVCCKELATETKSDKILAKLNLPECGRSTVDDSDRIVGGKNATKGAWPWMALIGYEDENLIFYCGGTIISKRHILTAAHCINRRLSFVRLGEYDLSTTSEAKHVDIKIADFKRHENYDPKYKLRDIAILTLEKDIEFSDTIAPICLPLVEPFRSEKHIKTSPFIAGWGKTENAGNQSSILQEVRIVVESNDKCEEGFKAVIKKFVAIPQQFDDSVLCAGLRGKDSCQGDSGGPLMTPERDSKKKTVYYQIGIVAYGIGCALEDVPGIYTSVQYFADWIKKQVEG